MRFPPVSTFSPPPTLTLHHPPSLGGGEVEGGEVGGTDVARYETHWAAWHLVKGPKTVVRQRFPPRYRKG